MSQSVEPDPSARRVAIMQPYFFPYLGYFQLMAAVDDFVLLDDVQFVRKGWMNRNRLLVNGAPSLVTIPVAQGSSRADIDQVKVASGVDWRRRILETIRHHYSRSAHFESVWPQIQDFFDTDEEWLHRWAERSLQWTADLLGIDTRIHRAGRTMAPGLRGAQRLQAICHEIGADNYINAPGGRALYSWESFAEEGLVLRFLEPVLTPYPQVGRSAGGAFVPGLSVLDALMNIGPDRTAREHLRGVILP